MEEYLKDKRGWLAAAIFVLTIVAVGTTKMLNRHSNMTLILLVFMAVVIVCVLNSGKPEDKKNEDFIGGTLE